MRVPRQTQPSAAAVLAFVLTTLAHNAACAGEGSGHSPFGVLEREGFPVITRLGTAEHEALFAPPEEAITDASGVAERSNLPADVVFAAPVLPADQEVVAAPAIIAPSTPLIASQIDALVFGPPSAQANSTLVPNHPASASSTPPSGARTVPAPSAEVTSRLKAQARELLANGSVASARALLEEAASGGDAESEYLLAQSYDPEVLTRSGVIGVAGDVGKAEVFYRAAQLGGYPRPDDNANTAQR